MVMHMVGTLPSYKKATSTISADHFRIVVPRAISQSKMRLGASKNLLNPNYLYSVS